MQGRMMGRMMGELMGQLPAFPHGSAVPVPSESRSAR